MLEHESNGDFGASVDVDRRHHSFQSLEHNAKGPQKDGTACEAD